MPTKKEPPRGECKHMVLNRVYDSTCYMTELDGALKAWFVCDDCGEVLYSLQQPSGLGKKKTRPDS